MDFPGSRIDLQPNDSNVPYSFGFDPCSSSTANDGSLPYGETIASADVKAYSSTGDDVTSDIVASSTVNGNVVNISLGYPVTNGAGKYKLTFTLTLNSGAVMEFDFERVFARDR